MRRQRKPRTCWIGHTPFLARPYGGDGGGFGPMWKTRFGRAHIIGKGGRAQEMIIINHIREGVGRVVAMALAFTGSESHESPTNVRDALPLRTMRFSYDRVVEY